MDHDPNYLRSAATISDIEFIHAVADLRSPSVFGPHGWVMIQELAEGLAIHPNRIRSKLRRLRQRGLVDGCNCGCRGDIELTTAGEDMLTTT